MAPASLISPRTHAALVAAVLLTALVLLAAPHAEARTKSSEKPPTASAKVKKGGGKATYRPSPSEETRAERERRLLRECRGMHNAGACKGYTRS